MSTSPGAQSDSLTRLVEQLQEEQGRLFAEVNFLLGKAIPQLEHEYLYCISLLELEVARTQLEIAKISETMRWYKEAVQNNVSVDQEQLGKALEGLELEWAAKINKHVHQGNNDLLSVTKFSYERQHIEFLLHEALNGMNTVSARSKTGANTDLLRRISAAYREGNLGELRALRMIIEGKRHSANSKPLLFSFKRFFRVLRIRFAKLFSL